MKIYRESALLHVVLLPRPGPGWGACCCVASWQLAGSWRPGPQSLMRIPAATSGRKGGGAKELRGRREKRGWAKVVVMIPTVLAEQQLMSHSIAWDLVLRNSFSLRSGKQNCTCRVPGH